MGATVVATTSSILFAHKCFYCWWMDSVRSFTQIFLSNWNIYTNLCGMIAWNLKICLLGFSSISQNSFELSYKYDTFCHLSPFYYGTFTRKFLLGFAAFMFHNVYVSQFWYFCRSSPGAPSTIYFNYFHIAFALLTTKRNSKKIPHRKHLFAQQSAHTHTHTDNFYVFSRRLNYAKSIAREKRMQIIIVVTNEQSWSEHFVTWHSPLNI